MTPFFLLIEPMRILIDNAIPFIHGTLESLADVYYMEGDKMRAENIVNVDILIVRTRTQCNQALLHGSSVKYIFTATIGTDHIDLTYCKANNILVRSAIGCNAGGVAQYVISAIHTYAKKKRIPFSQLTLGIVGVGHTGKKVEQYAKALGIKILLNDPPRAEKEGTLHFLPLETVLQEADMLSFHVPLTLEGKYPTYHLLDEKRLSHIRNNSLIINTSRGDLIQDERIFRSYMKRTSSSFVFDVWKNEPYIDPLTLQHSWIGTPHIAGYSLEGKWNATQMALDFFAEINRVPPIKLLPLKVVELTIPTNKIDDILDFVLSLYPIASDNQSLRMHPDQFELLRNTYAFRREFGGYTLQGNIEASLLNTLKRLDFS